MCVSPQKAQSRSTAQSNMQRAIAWLVLVIA
jgi:hypothetical protein